MPGKGCDPQAPSILRWEWKTGDERSSSQAPKHKKNSVSVCHQLSSWQCSDFLPGRRRGFALRFHYINIL